MIYLDNCATTQPLPEVLEVMARVSRDCFGNPSSIHAAGRRAGAELARAREVLAASLEARPSEIVLTSSGTEANNMVVSGVISRLASQAPQEVVRVVTSACEHASVRTVLQWGKRRRGDGLEVVEIGVDREGRLLVPDLERALEQPVHLLTLLHCNNETGVLQDLELLRRVRFNNPRMLLHLDVVQSYTKHKLSVRELPVDFLTTAAHKIHGPRGAAFLFVRDGAEFDPLLLGGAQEKFRRAGTEDVAAATGIACAVELAPSPEEHRAHAARLEAAFCDELNALGTRWSLNGAPDHDRRMAGIFNLSFPGVRNKEDLQIACDLDGVCVSSTSACHSGVVSASHVLAAMGVPVHLQAGALRFAVSRHQTEDEIRQAARITAKVVRRLVKPGGDAQL